MESIADMLGVELPVIQAPMAGSQNYELAVAVTKAGGLGSIPCGMLSPDQVVAEIQNFTKHSSSTYNLNFFCHQMPDVTERALEGWQKKLSPYFKELGIEPSIDLGGLRKPFSHEMADAIESFAPPVMSFHFGLPERSLLDRVKGWGSTILSSATTLQEAMWLEQQGVDAVIAQGIEAGGHRGIFLSNDLSSQVSTALLLEQCVSKLSIPVIAAGGISSPDAISDCFKCGASAVQLGTVFLLCDESKATPVHRNALKAEEAFTAVTNLFSGRPARGINNRFMQAFGDIDQQVPAFPYGTPPLAGLRKAAESKGVGDFSPLWSGTDRSGCQEISATDLLIQLWSDVDETTVDRG